MKPTLTIGWIPPLLWLLGSVVVLSAGYRFFITGQAIVSGIMPADSADVPYFNHPYLAALHIVPGVLFVVLGPLQFVAGIRSRWPAFHRGCGWVFIVSGVIFAITAVWLNLVFPPVGGRLKSAAVFVFSAAQILSLGFALRAIFRKQILRHRAWMIRAFAIGLSVASMRIFFIPLYLLFGLPNDFTIGVGMWVAFIINILVAEIFLWRERSTGPIDKSH